MAQRRRTRRPRRTTQRRTPPAQSSDPQPSMDHAAAAAAVVDDNSSKTQPGELETSEEISNNGFSTPKAQRFRIPDILTCPPAPKKRRPNYSLKRSPIGFFSPPDLELFFFFALGDVSV